jgi:DNA-binding SARP family transcriptional activator
MDLVEIRRAALLDRLDRAQPALLALVAPAGFGKSTLLRQYMRGRAGRLCDCAGLRDDLDLARRLMPELARELEDGGASVAERIARALEAWSSVTGTVAFENAQHLAGGSSARRLLKRLLEARPERATIAIVTRPGARFQFSRYASPHETVVLRAGDLAFAFEEIADIFASDTRDPVAIGRIARITEGWPVAVSLLRRAARERGIAELLSRLDAIAFEELRDYVIDEVLIGLDARVVQALFACAAIPSASADDVRVASGDPTLVDALLDFAKDSPFAAREAGGTFHVHPLLAALLVEHQEERRAAMLRDVAQAHEEARDYERAAAMHAARGDQHAAARALAKHEALNDRRPSETYTRVLAGIDRAVVARYPRLWGMNALSRIYCVETERLVDEAESIWRTLAPDASPMERLYVMLFRILFSSYAGSFSDAFEMIDGFARACGAVVPPRSLFDAYVVYLRALLQVRTGSYSAAEVDFNSALSLLGEIDFMASSVYRCLGADIARARGERSIETQFLERSLERARLSGFENIAALDLAETAFGAWFAGDIAAFNAAVDELDHACRRANVVGFNSLIAAARGRRAEPSPTDVARSAIYGRLVSLGTVRDASERTRVADAAFSLAGRVANPFLEVLAAVALGTCDELRFGECLAAARRAAERCESPELVRAVDAVAGRRTDVGMLGAFVANLERGRTDAPSPIAIDVTMGRVRVEGEPVALSDRELELVLALAMRRESTSRSRLASMLWPDVEPDAARNALSVCLHRLRTHLGRADVIVRERDGYRLHHDAAVDLWEIERVTGLLRSRERLHESDRIALERTWTKLREERPERLERWEWFEPVRRRLNGLRAEMSHRLGIEALEAGDTARALQFSYDAIGLDACDEPAYEVVIRAHLKDGDRTAALRAFRSCRDTLAAELACEPSAELAALVAG